MGTFDHSFDLATPKETTALAQKVAPVLVAGDVLLLYGELGAGKTHFARGLIQARLGAGGESEDVPSPTFTLVQTYFDGGTEIWHADLFRLDSPDQVSELGLSDAFETAVCLIEWPDRLGDALPQNALALQFSFAMQGRRLRMTGAASHWQDRIARALADEAI